MFFFLLLSGENEDPKSVICVREQDIDTYYVLHYIIVQHSIIPPPLYCGFYYYHYHSYLLVNISITNSYLPTTATKEKPDDKLILASTIK